MEDLAVCQQVGNVMLVKLNGPKTHRHPASKSPKRSLQRILKGPTSTRDLCSPSGKFGPRKPRSPTKPPQDPKIPRRSCILGPTPGFVRNHVPDLSHHLYSVFLCAGALSRGNSAPEDPSTPPPPPPHTPPRSEAPGRPGPARPGPRSWPPPPGARWPCWRPRSGPRALRRPGRPPELGALGALRPGWVRRETRAPCFLASGVFCIGEMLKKRQWRKK